MRLGSGGVQTGNHGCLTPKLWPVTQGCPPKSCRRRVMGCSVLPSTLWGAVSIHEREGSRAEPVGCGFVWSARLRPGGQCQLLPLASQLLEVWDQGVFVSGSPSAGHAGLRGVLGMKRRRWHTPVPSRTSTATDRTLRGPTGGAQPGLSHSPTSRSPDPRGRQTEARRKP